MEIVIVAQGLVFGPTTIEYRSLGGSETAALCMARELKKLNHLVTIFCNLPTSGMHDFIPNGVQDDLGVRWVSIEQFKNFITKTNVDLLIVSRNPDLLLLGHQAKKAVLWCHDLATYKGMLPRLMQSAWNFDEIWTVSEFHRKQIHDITGFPLKNIRATRNGIVKFDSILDIPKEPKSLLYSARPERGLENLVKPDGIMSKLPDFHLSVTMYENYPDHMMEYYHQLWSWAEKLDNVKVLGPKTQLELRQMMRGTWLYVYPTAFEEVSCIIAREAMEQGLPFITTTIGALPETLQDCAIFYDIKKEDVGTDEFCEKFSDLIKKTWEDKGTVSTYNIAKFNCSKRKDLYWDQVAKQWENWAEPNKPSDYSLISSLIKDADIIPAIEYMKGIKEKTKGLEYLENELITQYPFLHGKISFEDHYKGIYELEEKKDVNERKEMRTLNGVARFEEISGYINKLPEGSHILEYGCAEGPVILGLAQRNPDKLFTGIDFVSDNIKLCEKFAKEHDIKNVRFVEGSTDNWPDTFGAEQDDPHHIGYDAAIIAEVLEHVEKPWEVTDFIETKVKLNGKIIITVPQGPWEWGGLQNLTQWNWRAHIWHINKWMLRLMYPNKKGCTLASIVENMGRDGRSRGHLIFTYTVDREFAIAIDPLEKVKQHHCRQTIAACMIAMDDEEMILKTLKSIQHDIDQLQIAIGPSIDHTKEFIEIWKKEHPWVETRIIDVPRIEAKKFGFDDARNASIKDIESDWILWIDSDEYLSGETIQVYLRNNCFDSYAIHQHHFTCQPRGEPAQLDKPARLMRNHIGFEFFGKVHEHAELGFNGGPGFVMVIDNIDIGHTGYVNEIARFNRFGRNYPLLKWDQEVYPERKLGRFLWLRDMIHRIRMMEQQGNKFEARRIAEEAIEFFNDRVKGLDGIGGNAGGNTAIAYYGEALKVLGRGHTVAIQVQLEEQVAQYVGVFESGEDAFDLAIKAINDEIKKRKSGYWQ